MPASASVNQQRQRLRRMRFFATALLLLACALFIFSSLNISQYPALAYLKALADWFAVTALFRHPLGIPIPHTAILPQKQDKIADELGRFIEHNFLLDKTIARHIHHLNPTSKVLYWLSQPQNQHQWQPFLTRQIPSLLHTATGKDIARFCTQLLNNQYSGARLGTTLSSILTLIRQQNIDTSLLRTLLRQLRRWLHDEQTRTQPIKYLTGLIPICKTYLAILNIHYGAPIENKFFIANGSCVEITAGINVWLPVANSLPALLPYSIV